MTGQARKKKRKRRGTHVAKNQMPGRLSSIFQSSQWNPSPITSLEMLIGSKWYQITSRRAADSIAFKRTVPITMATTITKPAMEPNRSMEILRTYIDRIWESDRSNNLSYSNFRLTKKQHFPVDRKCEYQKFSPTLTMSVQVVEQIPTRDKNNEENLYPSGFFKKPWNGVRAFIFKNRNPVRTVI